MKTLHFSSSLCNENVDTVNAVIRGVSVITGGLVARGHGLAVDATTLGQMFQCARAKEKIPVKVDHKSGAAAICGFLTNFRLDENKLKADWYLLESHPQKDQILEVAQRMPHGVGLSAAFVSPDNGEPGKARCEELISVDYVTLPAANPDGLFSAQPKERRLTGVERVRRVIHAAGQGAESGALGGLVVGGLLKRANPKFRIKSNSAAATGALAGAVVNGALQYRDDKKRDLQAVVSSIMFGSRDQLAYTRLRDAVSNNVTLPSVPGIEEASAVAKIAKKPLARRIAVRAVKIGAGAALGHYAGKKLGARAGAISGAVAGALFSSPEVRSTVRLSILHAKRVTNL